MVTTTADEMCLLETNSLDESISGHRLCYATAQYPSAANEESNSSWMGKIPVDEGGNKEPV